MTRYEKRDRSGFFVDSAFLVWVVSTTSVESNGASLKEKFTQKPSYKSFLCTRDARCHETIFGETGIFIYFLFNQYTSVLRSDITSHHVTIIDFPRHATCHVGVVREAVERTI